MKLSASIMAHPDRAEHVHRMREQFHTEELDRIVPVSWDTEGKPSGNSDRVWRNARRGWELHDPNADWHALIQDDALPCPDFLPALERALEHVPDDAVVSPYLGSGRNVPIRWEALARAATTAGASWVRTEKLMWGVCIVLPVKLIGEMVEWAERRTGIPDDMRVAGWAGRRSAEVWYTWPSLVDHAPVPSLTKHRAADRRARLHHSGSALDLVWSGPVVTDPMLTRRKGPRSAVTRNRPVRSRLRGERTREAGNGA